MLYAAPAQIGDMHEAVHAADVHEGAKVRQAANDALHHGTYFQGFPDLLLLLGFFRHQHGLAAGDDALLGLVDLDDLQRHGLAHELVDLLDIAQGKLAGGDEGADAAHVGQQAALDGFLADAFDELAGLFLGADVFPRLAVDDVLLGKHHVAFAVVHLDDFDFDFIAFLDIGGRKLGFLYDTVRLVADVDANLIVGDHFDLASDDLAGANLNYGLVNGLF